MKQPSPLYIGVGVAITVVDGMVDDGDGSIDVEFIAVTDAVAVILAANDDVAVTLSVTNADAVTLAATDAVAFMLDVGDTVAAMVDET